MDGQQVNPLVEWRKKVESGEIDAKVSRYNPIERANKFPESLELAIYAQCYDCMGQAVTWRDDVRKCTDKRCPLYRHRQYK